MHGAAVQLTGRLDAKILAFRLHQLVQIHAGAGLSGGTRLGVRTRLRRIAAE
jgi:hypothetical protein